MTHKPFMVPCAACGTAFQFGPHIYAGKHLPRYKVSVCRSCYGSNYEGWSPLVEHGITATLLAEGLPLPERNEAGYLPRD